MTNHQYKSPFDFDLSKMTVEEAQERLREMGIDPGSWTDNKDTVKGGEKVQLPTFKYYAKMLEKIRDIMQDQVEHDVQEIDALNYQLKRLQRGGGK